MKNFFKICITSVVLLFASLIIALLVTGRVHRYEDSNDTHKPRSQEEINILKQKINELG